MLYVKEFRREKSLRTTKAQTSGAPRGLGDLGRMAVYFQGAGEHRYNFQGFGEQPHSFGDLGSLQKSFKKSHLKGKALISYLHWYW